MSNNESVDIPDEAVEAAVRARRQLRLGRYYSTRRVVSTTYEGHHIYTASPEPTEEEYARAALEAAAPHIAAEAWGAGYRLAQDAINTLHPINPYRSEP